MSELLKRTVYVMVLAALVGIVTLSSAGCGERRYHRCHDRSYYRSYTSWSYRQRCRPTRGTRAYGYAYAVGPHSVVYAEADAYAPTCVDPCDTYDAWY